MSKAHYSRSYVGLFILLSLQGCSTNRLDFNTQSDEHAEVQIQVCLSTKRVYFNEIELEQLENHSLFTKYTRQQLELAPRTVRRIASSSDPKAIHAYGISLGEVLLRDGGYSDGFGFMPLRDSTISDQPVYQRGYGYPARNYIAIHVRLPDSEKGEEGRVTYWFTLPKDIPSDTFSNWFLPVSMEPEGQRVPMWWKLTHGKDLEIYPVALGSPKMRVTSKRMRTGHDDPTIDTLPALTTARKQYRTATSDKQFVYEFVPIADETIPACD